MLCEYEFVLIMYVAGRRARRQARHDLEGGDGRFAFLEVRAVDDSGQHVVLEHIGQLSQQIFGDDLNK